jgi:glycosyltransferase involved in cell wall biosynthesis
VLLVVEQLRRSVPGGIGTYAGGLIGGLVRGPEDPSRTEVALLASRPPRSGDDPLAALGPPLVTSPWPGRLLTRAWDHGWIHAPEGYHVVHSASFAVPPLHRGRTSQAVVTVHDVAWRFHPEATTRRGRRWHERALGRVRRSNASVVTPSRLVAADLEAVGIGADRITVIPSGADHLPPPDPVATGALLDRLGVRGPFVLTVGTLEPRKNLARLTEAYARVRPSLPGPWPLVLVGPAGWGTTPVTGGPREGVVFAGAVAPSVLAGLYGRARAFAYVPLTEGYGMPPLEAMVAGTPTVVSDRVPSVHDLGASGPAPARLVDPFDVSDVAAGLLEVLADGTRRDELTAAGTAHARRRTWAAAAERYVELWESLR